MMMTTGARSRNMRENKWSGERIIFRVLYKLLVQQCILNAVLKETTTQWNGMEWNWSARISKRFLVMRSGSRVNWRRIARFTFLFWVSCGFQNSSSFSTCLNLLLSRHKQSFQGYFFLVLFGNTKHPSTVHMPILKRIASKNEDMKRWQIFFHEPNKNILNNNNASIGASESNWTENETNKNEQFKCQIPFHCYLCSKFYYAFSIQ